MSARLAPWQIEARSHLPKGTTTLQPLQPRGAEAQCCRLCPSFPGTRNDEGDANLCGNMHNEAISVALKLIAHSFPAMRPDTSKGVSLAL